MALEYAVPFCFIQTSGSVIIERSIKEKESWNILHMEKRKSAI